MALGAVQSGYAGTTYTYRRTTGSKEEFYSNISSAAQMIDGECKNDSKVIGLAMIPYGDTNVSYGMKAQYAAEYTPDNPVIQVTSNYGGEWVSYKVNVNEVDPRNASQIEMFALLSYSDDQGISDGESFGSYNRMKVYTDNAKMNGHWEGNDNWEDFINAKHDWIDIMTGMTEDYSHAGVYSQYLNAQKLLGTLSHFSIRHVDFDNLKIEDRSADMFSHYKLNIPKNVLKAWFEVSGEGGADGMDNDMFTHMSSVMLWRFEKYYNVDAVGDPIEAALKAAKEALQALEYPLTPELGVISEVRKELEEESAFYRSFIEKLEKLQENNGTENKVENTETTDKYENVADKADAADFMEFIRKRMEEILALIKNGGAEESFQIGNSSFTIKEWKEFLKQFDDMEDAIRELMREEFEKRTEETAQETEEETAGKKDSSENSEGVDALLSECTKCTYPNSTPGKEDTTYITWYTEEGIFCRKAGQSKGYEWSIRFENKEDYNRVIGFLDGLDKEANLRFAGNKNFWLNFLKNK